MRLRFSTAIHLRDDLREESEASENCFHFILFEPLLKLDVDSGETLRICALNHLRSIFSALLFIVSIDAIFTWFAQCKRWKRSENMKWKSSHFMGNENDNEDISPTLRPSSIAWTVRKIFLFLSRHSKGTTEETFTVVVVLGI